jgi:recombination protein RecA
MAKRLIKTFNFLQALEDNFEDALIDDSTDHAEQVKVISTGATSLDVALGIGGIPLKRFTEIYGAESTGKTTLALSIVRSAIKEGHRVLYADPEHGLDLRRAEQLLGEDAHDKSKFVLVQPELMEQTLRICEYAIQEGTFGLIVLDSIASMTPKKVKEEQEVDKTAGVALLARGFGNFLNRNAYDISHKDIAFIGVNQVRDKFGTFFPMFETTGGHNWKHRLSIRISLTKSKEIKAGGSPIGILSKFVIKKNKMAPPLRTYTIPIMFDTGVDFYRDLIEFAKDMGIIRVSGAYYIFDNNSLASGMINTIEYLKGNPDILDRIVEACYSITNIGVADEEADYE